MPVRKVTPDGIIHTIAGGGTFGFVGDGTPASTANIAGVGFLALDGDGNLYLTTGMVFRISTFGELSIVAGSPETADDYTGDGGPATQAGFAAGDLAIDADGRIYLADGTNGAVRVLVPEHTPGRGRR